jgi:L-iditol 2-dehydrogenase
VSDVEASLLEPFSCVVNGVRTSRMELGDVVVIYGAGPIGLMHVMLCRARGAGQVMTIDPRPERLERARSLGSDLTLDPLETDVPARVHSETGGAGADVVITACPVPEVQSEAVRLLAPFGRLCLFGGLPRAEGPVPLDTNAIHYGSYLVTGSTGGAIDDYRIALRLVAGKRVDLTRVISDVYPLSDLSAAYGTALAGADGKVVLVTE